MDVFQKFWIGGKFSHFWFICPQDQLYDKKRDKNNNEPENYAHVIEKRNEFVSNQWKWGSFEFSTTHARFYIEKIESEDLELALYLKLDHFSQLHINSKNMHQNEWGQNQGDKWEHFRIPKQVFDVAWYQDHHYNRCQNRYIFAIFGDLFFLENVYLQKRKGNIKKIN